MFMFIYVITWYNSRSSRSRTSYEFEHSAWQNGIQLNTTYRHGERKRISDYTRYLTVSLSSSRGISQEQEPHTAVCRNTSKLDSFSSPAMWFLQQYFLPENNGEVKNMDTLTWRKSYEHHYQKKNMWFILVKNYFALDPLLMIKFALNESHFQLSPPHKNKQTNKKISIFMLQP